jgi:hypothetical protein
VRTRIASRDILLPNEVHERLVLRNAPALVGSCIKKNDGPRGRTNETEGEGLTTVERSAAMCADMSEPNKPLKQRSSATMI